MKRIIFLKTAYTNSIGESSLFLRFRVNNVKTEISLDIWVNPDSWNKKKNEVYKTDIDFRRKNILIDKAKLKADNIINAAKLQDKILSTKEFKLLFKVEAANSNSFFAYAENEKKSREHEFSSATIYSYKKQISKLKRFCPGLLIGEIDLSFIRKYHGYHLNTLKDNENTAYAAHRWLKGMINKAIKKGLLKVNPYKDFPIKNPEGHREFLTVEELKNLEVLYNKSTLKPNKQSVLQYFLFVCYTGLRYSDIKNLRYKNIIDTENKKKEISMLMQKTKEIVKIPLCKKAEYFLTTGFIEQKIFHVLTNQKTNSYLKEIIKIAEINKNISFHCARHTFAMIALSLDVQMPVISNILGHKSLKTTQIYAKAQNESKVKCVELFDTI